MRTSFSSTVRELMYMKGNTAHCIVFDANGSDGILVEAEGAIMLASHSSFPTQEQSLRRIYGKELAGAELQLIDSEGNVLDEWASDGTNHLSYGGSAQ